MNERTDAFRIRREPFAAALTTMDVDDLSAGEVLVEVLFSSVNYKDALAGSGRGAILRVSEANGGIDLAGRVVRSDSDAFAVGDEVFVCGSGGLSESRDGGYATRARVPAAVLRRPPAGLSLRDTMAIGTAGITAAIALERLEANGQPKDRGPIVVTGASGGVGSFAVHLLARRGYEVAASTGKAGAHDYLRALGAAEIVGRIGEGEGAPRPLERARWGGAVDNVGGATLARLASVTRPWGSIACVGLAGGATLETTVMPLILRGVSLLGINCLEVPGTMLDRCWTRLADELDAATLSRIAPHETTLDALLEAFDAILAGEMTGRTVVRVALPGSDRPGRPGSDRR